MNPLHPRVTLGIESSRLGEFDLKHLPQRLEEVRVEDGCAVCVDPFGWTKSGEDVPFEDVDQPLRLGVLNGKGFHPS